MPLIDVIDVEVTRYGTRIRTLGGAVQHASALRARLLATRDADAFTIFYAAQRARAAAGIAAPQAGEVRGGQRIDSAYRSISPTSVAPTRRFSGGHDCRREQARPK